MLITVGISQWSFLDGTDLSFNYYPLQLPIIFQHLLVSPPDGSRGHYDANECNDKLTNARLYLWYC